MRGTGAAVQHESVPWLKLFLAALPCSLAGMGALLLPTLLSFGPCGPGPCATDLLVVFLRGLLPLQSWSDFRILASFGGFMAGLLPYVWWFGLRKRSPG